MPKFDAQNQKKCSLDIKHSVIYNKIGVVAEIIVNRPKAYNALNPEVFKRFFECIDENSKSYGDIR
jgi:enoyl-CoA hydratase/carnithine racemase